MKPTMRYDGMIHDFGLLNGLAQEGCGSVTVSTCGRALKRYL